MYKNNIKLKNNKDSGFAILYVMLVIAITLTSSIAIIKLVSRESTLSKSARDSLNARASADVGLECMLFMDKAPSSFDPIANPGTFTTDCGRDFSGTNISYNVTLTSSSGSGYNYSVTPVSSNIDGPCFKGYIVRDTSGLPIKTRIDIFGYNTCKTGALSKVERGIVAEYESQ